LPGHRFRDFECAEDAKVEVSAARDRETIGVMHQGGSGDHRDVLERRR